MPDEPMPLPKAARLLGLTPEAVRQRIKRGEIEGFRDNRGRWQVRLGESDQQPLASGLPNVAELAEAKADLARWQERADQLGKRLADRDRELAEVKVERDRLLAMLDEALAAPRKRRPWPGLKAWWRRVWAGQG
jgi:hypothetical protein